MFFKKVLPAVLFFTCLVLQSYAQDIASSRRILYKISEMAYDSSYYYSKNGSSLPSHKRFHGQDSIVAGYRQRKLISIDQTDKQVKYVYFYGGLINNIADLSSYVEYGGCPINPYDWAGPSKFTTTLTHIISKVDETHFSFESNAYCQQIDSVIQKYDIEIDNVNTKLIYRGKSLNSDGQFIKFDSAVAFYVKNSNDNNWYFKNKVEYDSQKKIVGKRDITYGNYKIEEMYYDLYTGSSLVDSIRSRTYEWANLQQKPFSITAKNLKGQVMYKYFFSSYQDVVTSLYEEKKKINSTTLYPNPASNSVYVESSKTIKSYQIHNVDGSALLTGALENSSINVESLPPGLYFLKLQYDSGIEVMKFVKE